MPETIVVAIISLIGTLMGSYLSQRKSSALIAYRLKQLEKKVDKHNNLVERIYKVEERLSIQEKETKVINHRIKNLEGGIK
jgi:hypothetical protein